MDVDNQPRLRQLPPQSFVLARELGGAMALSHCRVGLGASLAGIKPGHSLGFTALAPCGQLGTVDAFTTQKRTDLAGLRTAIRCRKDAPLRGRRELAATGNGNHFRICRRDDFTRGLADCFH